MSPEAIFEIGCVQNQATSRMYCYDFGRGSNGGNNTAPNKVFAGIRTVVMITLINVAMSVRWLPGWMVKAMSWHLLLRRVLRLMEVFA